MPAVRNLAAVLIALAAGGAMAQAPSSVSVPQISRPAAGGTGQGIQVPSIAPAATRRSEAAQAPSQIGGGARTATAAPPLSTPAQGRAVRVTPLTGNDGCDDAAMAKTELCQRRIENRSSEYAAPASAPVTAEGRLLMLIAPNDPTGTPDVRRLGDAGSALQDIVGDAAGQVASALGQPSTPPAPVDNSRPGSNGLPSTVVINPGR